MGLNFFLLNFLASIPIFGFTLSEAQMVPAMYIFGDSLVDVGNNNYLKLSINKADFPPFGIDFPSRLPTGRFSNGKNTADFLAEKVGLPTPPPFLSLNSSKDPAAFLTGVNFASAGAGIFDGSDNPFDQVLPLTNQVDSFSDVYEELKQRLGSSGAQELLSKSIFPVVIGSNDITNYYDSSDLRKKSSPPEYVASMVLKLKEQLKRLYSKGARKFVMIGLSAIGCLPSIRKDIEREECGAEVNEWSTSYNQALTLMLKELASEIQDIKYSYFDTYSVLSNLIVKPASYGFLEVKTACCGLGHLRAAIPCQPLSAVCSNRSDHVFWDGHHPTEACTRLIIDTMFHRSSEYTFPMNVWRLAAVSP